MSRNHDRLAQLRTHLSPQEAEREQVGLFMCELLVDLLDVLTGGVEQGPADSTGPDQSGDTAERQASGDADEGAQGGASVQLQEPDVPPADLSDDAGISDTRQRAVAEQTTSTTRSGRPTATRGKATKKTTAKKTTTPPAE